MNPRLAVTAAVVGLLGLGVVIIVTKPGESEPIQAEWVMPDCGPTRAPVDCLFGGPYSRDGGPRWRGCNVGRAEFAVGTQCVAAPGEVWAGNRIEKRGGQFVEVDSRTGATVQERVPDGGRRPRDAGALVDAGVRDAGAGGARDGGR